ncbi:hypothetical protein [Edaphobacter bradus]|uniref:hypothetical protein n=1 Tax=Edaphobacter bradus TaxID=2259016 RepID=UPI0021E0859B|nr:hypothetical protein [Edaphobacter bradus]
MKYIVSKIALFVAAISITCGVWAQARGVKATVPFAFTVNDTVFPAGNYTLTADSTSSIFPNLLRLDGWDKRTHTRLIATHEPNERGKANVLVFHRYGDEYFLNEIRSADSSMYFHFAMSKAEKKVMAQTVLAGLQPGNEVTVEFGE